MASPLFPFVRAKRQRSDTSRHIITLLRERGEDTSWYDKSPRRQPIEAVSAKACSWFTIFILDGDFAYTKTGLGSGNPGDKYMEYRRLEKPVEVPCYYCAHCKRLWPSYDEAVAHLGEAA